MRPPPGDDRGASDPTSRTLARRSRRLGGVLVFAVALLMRLAFWQATPDRHWPGSAVYAGDATTWVAQAARLVDGESSGGRSGALVQDAALPLRPPANAWLIATFGGGDVERAKLAWCVLGAMIALFAYQAALAAFGFAVALGTGLVCAASTALLSLSTSLNNETPYLLLVMATLVLWRPLRDRPGWSSAVAWGVLHAAATLVRAEHLLFTLLATGVLAFGWKRSDAALAPRRPVRRPGRPAAIGRAGGRWVVVTAMVYLLVLAPWHLASWRAIERMNTIAPDTPGERLQRRLEERLSGVAWEPAAAAEREGWPAFARRTAANFVTATVAWRGGHRVSSADLAILDDAFGTRPAPLAGRPFVALYGGLNFWLANNPAADGGFSRGPLAVPPPLAGGAALYPPALIAGLPPDDLALTYPPHLAAVNQGWGRGLAWIAGNPVGWLRLVTAKVERLVAGATLGLTGYGFPLGLSGFRRPVDLVVPETGKAVVVWRIVIFLAAVLGGVSTRPRRDLVPWLLFVGAQLAVAVTFFGYARLGATITPCVALLVVLAVQRRISSAPPRRALALAAAAGAAFVAVETWRAVESPVLRLDGLVVGAEVPLGADEHVGRRLTVGR